MPQVMRRIAAAWYPLMALAACSGGAGRSTGPAKPTESGDPKGAHEAAVKGQVQPLVDGELLSGVVVGLYDAGKTEIYGFGKGPGGNPPNGRTLFEIGSITKVYTALLLADAIQRREVALETPVADLLPPGVTAPTRDQQVITLRHLALHSSGLPRIPPAIEARETAPDPYAGYGENELYADLVRTQLETVPGTDVMYSNYGYGLLGHLLGKKLGGYRESVSARILKPLGLTDTSFSIAADAASRRAQGTNEELVRVPPWTFDALAGAGALISSAHDQLALIDAELDAAAGGKHELRRAMAFTQEPQLEKQGANVGLGWQIDSAGRYWHNGGTGGHHSFVGFDPKTRRGVVVLASTSTSLVDQLAPRLYKVLAGETVAAPKLPTEAQLASFAGTYDFAGEQLKILAVGKRLYVEGPGEPKLRIAPVAEDKFLLEALGAVLVFESENGKVARVVFLLGDKQISAKRIDVAAPSPAPAPAP
jgi:serine-type D-Ala-D-Ala carboxypeptidase/endopeptidase